MDLRFSPALWVKGPGGRVQRPQLPETQGPRGAELVPAAVAATEVLGVLGRGVLGLHGSSVAGPPTGVTWGGVCATTVSERGKKRV